MDPVVSFLTDRILPEDKTKAKKIRRNAPRYWLSEEQKLYKQSYSEPYLLCTHLEAVEALLEELHNGMCSSHTGGKSLSHRALTQCYWWPNMQKSTQDYFKKCDQSKGMPQIFINPRGPQTLFPVHGLLHSEAWI